MGKTKLHLKTDFDLLQIRVTDDAAAVEAAFKRLLPKMSDLKNHGTHEERKDAELFYDAHARLKKADRRDALIEEIFELATNQLDLVLDARAGEELSPAVYDKLLAVLTEQFNFEPALAERKLRAHLEGMGLQTGRVIKIEIEKARLVDDLRATPRSEGVLLTWTLPTADCEGVVLVRTQGGPAKSHDEGTPLATERVERYLDTGALSGRKYFYSVFSVLADRPSSQCRHCEGFRAPEGVENFQARYVHPGVRLTWSAPEFSQRVFIYRSTEPAIDIPLAGDRLVTPPNCVQLAATVDEEITDDSAVLGVVYYYHAVADHGRGMFSERVTTSVRLPAPVPPPRAVGVTVHPGRVSVEWASTVPGHCTFRVYRRADAGLLNLDDEPAYVGPDTRFDDKRVTPGESYWYYIVASDEGVTSASTQLGPVLALEEVRNLDARAGIRSVHLKWHPPPRTVRVLVVRSDDRAPASLREGATVSGVSPTGVTDKDVKPGRVYGYRVACVFRDADGREVTTAGVTAPTCQPFEMPSAPRNVHATVEQNTIRVAWDPPREGSISVFRRAADPLGKGGQVVTLAVLEAESERLDPKGGREVSDPFDLTRPWYVLATVLHGSAVIHQRVCIAALDIRREKIGDALVLRWPWPEGLGRVELARQVFNRDGAEDKAGRRKWVIDRPSEGAEGEHTDQIEDPARPHRRVYSVRPVNLSDSTLLVLNVASPCTVSCGPTTWVKYEIVPPRSGLFGLRRGRPYLRIKLDARVEDFPGVRLVAQPSRPRGDEGEVLLIWPNTPGPVGAGEFEIEIPSPEQRGNEYATLFLNGPADRPDLKVQPLQGLDRRRL